MATTDEKLSALLGQNAALFAAYEVFSNGQTMLLGGSVEDPDSFDQNGGKSGPLGYYPVVNVSGDTIYVPCIDRLSRLDAATAAALDGQVQPTGRLVYDSDRRVVRVGDGATPGGRYQVHIVRDYVGDLPGVRIGVVSAPQRAINRGAINAALAQGRVLRLRAGDYIEIDQSLILVAAGAGIICEKDGTRPIIFMPAAHFNRATNGVATRYDSNAVGINVKGALSGNFAPIRKPMLGGFVLQSEVADNRSIIGIAVVNALDLLIDTVEVTGLPLGVGINVQSTRGDSQIRNAYVHDFYTDTTASALVSGAPNTTAILLGSDEISANGVKLYGNEGVRILNVRIHDIRTGPAFQAANRPSDPKAGDQSDGINLASTMNSGIVVRDFDIRRTAEPIDSFACRSIISGGYIEEAYSTGVKLVHGASDNVISNITMHKVGLAGVTFGSGGDDTASTARNRFSEIVITGGVDYAGKWADSSSAAVLINAGSSGVAGIQARDNVVTGLRADLGATGAYGWLDQSFGSGNVGREISFDWSGTRSGEMVNILNGAGDVQLRGSPARFTKLSRTRFIPQENVVELTGATATYVPAFEETYVQVRNADTGPRTIRLRPGWNGTIANISRTASITASISGSTLTVTSIDGGATNSTASSALANGQILSAMGVISGTRITGQLTSTESDTSVMGKKGTYSLSRSQTVSSTSMTVVFPVTVSPAEACSFTGGTTGTLLTVEAVTSGAVYPGMAIQQGPSVAEQLSGVKGGKGTYRLTASPSSDVAAGSAMLATVAGSISTDSSKTIGALAGVAFKPIGLRLGWTAV